MVAQRTLINADDSEVRRLQAHKKTQLCKFFAVGACTRGSSCAFAHGTSQLREQPDFSKTRLCADFMERGRCERGRDCKFAHGKHELRPGSAAKIGRPSRSHEAPSSPTQSMGFDGKSVTQALETLRKRHLSHEHAAMNLVLHCQVAGSQSPPAKGKQAAELDGRMPFSRQTTCEGVESASAVFSRSSSDEISLPDAAFTRAVTEGTRELPHVSGLEVRVKNTFIDVQDDEYDYGASSLRRTKSMPSLPLQ